MNALHGKGSLIDIILATALTLEDTVSAEKRREHDAAKFLPFYTSL
jgi:hypothetical protein